MTTKCNTSINSFKPVKNRKIQLNFEGGNITSDGGLLLLKEVDSKLDLLKKASTCIPDPRNQSKITHSILSMLKQRVYGIALGYEDLNDHDNLKNDILFQTATDQVFENASSPTLCRFENNVDRAASVEINKLFVETFINSYSTPPKEIILDFDATEDPVHGNQEGRFYHGYYGNYCFLPLHVFCGNHLLISYLRESSKDGALHTGAILKLLVTRIRESWPEVKIIFRADSGFCRQLVLNWCERNNVQYIVGIAGNKRLRNLTLELEEKVKNNFTKFEEKQKEFFAFKYGAKSWEGEKNTIAKVEYSINGLNIRYIVTNIDAEAEYLYSDLYCGRGEMENKIKEQKLLFSDRTSCQDWYPNQFRLVLSGLAYVLLDNLRRIGLTGTVLAKSQVNTIRLQLLKIGGVVLRNTRSIKIMLSSAHSFKNIFNKIATKICTS